MQSFYTTIKSAAEGNPYTNVDILPGATVKMKLEPNKRYEIGVSLVPAAAADVPVKISVRSSSLLQPARSRLHRVIRVNLKYFICFMW